MKEITKESIEEFLNYYHYFHDSTIEDFNYNFKTSEILITIDVFWSGKPKLKENGYYETNKTKIKMILKKKKEFKIDEENDFGYIDHLYFKFINLNKKEYLCFATAEKDPHIYIVCDKVKYEEIKS